MDTLLDIGVVILSLIPLILLLYVPALLDPTADVVRELPERNPLVYPHARPLFLLRTQENPPHLRCEARKVHPPDDPSFENFA